MTNSPIINSFEKIAINKGLLEPRKQEEQIKIQASDDLNANLILLTKELRKRGYSKEASELENNYFTYKMAEKHLYKVFDESMQDLLEFAHPEKNVEILKATDQLGEVETTDEIHRKMLETVFHKPTGKNHILANVAISLGLVKEAQEADQKKKNDDVKELAADEAQSRLDDLKIKNPKKYTKIVKINDSLKENFAKVAGATSAAISYAGFKEGSFIFKFVISNLEQGKGLDYYSAKSGVSRDKIVNYINTKYYILGAKKFADVQNLDSVIEADIYRNYKSADSSYKLKYKSIPGAYSMLLGANYYRDSYVSEENFNKYLTNATKNENSIFDAKVTSQSGKVEPIAHYTINKGKLSAFVSAVTSWFSTEYEAIFGEKVIAKANEAAAKDFTPLYTVLNGINTKAVEFSSLRVMNTSALVLSKADELIAIIDEESKKIPQFKDMYIALTMADYTAGIIASLLTAKAFTNSIKEFLTKPENVLEKGLEGNVDKVTKAAILDTYRNIYIWADLYAREAPNKDQKDWAKSVSSIASNVYNVLSKEGENFGAMLPSLPKEMQEYTSPEELLSAGQEYLTNLLKIKNLGKEITSIKEEEKEASSNFDIIKEAALPPPPGGKPMPKQSPGGQQHVVQQPQQYVGSAKFDSNSPDQVAVANMQLALNNLGRLISIESNKSKFQNLKDYNASDGLKIIGTGPRSNPHLNMFDGKWGANTDAALALAQKYANALGITLTTGVKWNAQSKSHADNTATAASENANSLNRINAFLSGQESKSPIKTSYVYDNLPSTINWNLDSGPAQASFDGGKIKVTSQDMYSLQSLYNFVTRNNLRAAERSGASEKDIGTVGWMPSTWNNVLQWFIRRAVIIYNAMSKSGEQAANVAKEYFNSAKQLLADYTAIINQLSNKGEIKPNSVIRPDIISLFSKKDEEDGAGSGYQMKKRKLTPEEILRQKLYGDYGSGGQGGQGKPYGLQSRPEEYPIGDTIDLKSSYWADENINEFTKQMSSNLLSLEEFLRVPGARMAQNLFSRFANQKEAQRKAIRHLGKNPVKWNKDDEIWMVYDGEVLVPATKFYRMSEIDQSVKDIMENAPSNAYSKFLKYLSAKLNEVSAAWEEEIDNKDLIIKKNKYRDEWQRGISKQLRDLQR